MIIVNLRCNKKAPSMKKLLFLLLFLYSTQNMFAQLVGDCNAPYDTAEGLVEILVGEGVEYSNVTFSGFDCSAGYYSGTSNIGFTSGLVMATNGAEAIAPGGAGGGGGGAGVDLDLTEQLEMVNASATNLNNLIVLEFDFVPNSDTVTFEYVFASNEYPGYTCSQFNDIFGFFLSGPGITGPFTNDAINIALVPDPNDPTEYTNTPVIINTINSGTPSFGDSTPCDDIDPDWQDYSIFFTDNQGGTTVSYPGFTIPLTARAVLTACETYHIKLAIADVADGALNSAVFFEQNSFTSIPDVDYVLDSDVTSIFNSNSQYVDDLFEGCGSVAITFERPPGIAGEILIDYTLEGDAEDMIDYSITNISGGQIVIEEGESEFELEITAINDNINEGSENMNLIVEVVNFGCYDVSADTIPFVIYDQPDLELETEALSILCAGDQLQLEVIASGGIGGFMEPPYQLPPYTYQWEGLGTNSTQIVFPTETTDYCVEVTDVCGQQETTCITALVEDYPDLGYITSEDVILECPGDQALLNVEPTGGMGSLMTPPFTIPPYTYQWEDLGTNASQMISAEEETEFCVEITDVCGQQVTGCINVSIQEFPPVVAESEVVYVCDSIESELCAHAIGGNETYTYLWSNGSTEECLFDYPGEYTIVVTDECGVSGNAGGEILVDEPSDPVFEQFQMANENYGISIINYTEPMNGLSYLWSFGDGSTSDEIAPNQHIYEEWGEYVLTLGVTTEINSCYKELSQIVQVAPLYYFYAPNTFSPNGDKVNDGFMPSIVGAKTFEIYIFDRWGRQVFYSDDINDKWDGTFESEELVQGTYTYKVITTKQFDEVVYEEFGYVNLLR